MDYSIWHLILLQELAINGCYNVSSVSLNDIALKCTKLEGDMRRKEFILAELFMARCRNVNSGVESIGKQCTRYFCNYCPYIYWLVTLDLYAVKEITDQTIIEGTVFLIFS